MDCAICRGACCETFSMDVAFYPTVNFHRDANRWLALHSITDLSSISPLNYEHLPKLEFECRCTQLTKEGRCAIWEERPMICELFIAGGQQCLETVRKRRTAEEYQLIRGEDDPPTIHKFPFAREWKFEDGKYVKIYDEEKTFMRSVTIRIHDAKGAWNETYTEGMSGSFTKEDTDLDSWVLNMVANFNATRKEWELERFIDSVIVEEIAMTLEKGIELIEELITKLNDQEDDLALELLDELSTRSSDAYNARQEDVKQDEDADDVEDEEDEEDDEGDEDDDVPADKDV